MSTLPYKDEWIAELRSGRRKQGTGTLRYQIGKHIAECCLGVYCDINPAFEWINNQDEDDSRFEAKMVDSDGVPSSSMTTIPSEYADEVLGWPNNNGRFVIPLPEHKHGPLQGQDLASGFTNDTFFLTELNDCGFTFPQIADVIEYFF